MRQEVNHNPKSGASRSPKRWSRQRDGKAQEPRPGAIRPLNKRHEHALDCHTFRLVDVSSDLDGNVTKNSARSTMRLLPQMRSHMLDEPGPISVISFLFAFMLACNTKEIHNGLDTWFFQYLMKTSSTGALNARLSVEPTPLSNAQGEEMSVEDVP